MAVGMLTPGSSTKPSSFMPASIATLGRPGCGICQSWAKPGLVLVSAITATCPFILSFTSHTVMSANSLLLVTQMAVGTLPGGSCSTGLVLIAVQVPALATRPLGNTISPQLDQLVMPRAMPSGTPGPLALIHGPVWGSGRKPPHHGGSGFSLKVPLVHSMMVTRSMPTPPPAA